MRLPPNHRRGIIVGLREFADELEVNPRIPVPLMVDISYYPGADNDDENKAEIDRVAALLGAVPETSADGEHYRVTRRFAGVIYRAVAVSSRAMARYDALHTYQDNITPDDPDGDTGR